MAVEAVTAAPEGGEVVFFGAVDWSLVGKVDVKKKGEKKAEVSSLPAPHRLKGLMGLNISFVSSGCNSSHCIAIDTAGACFTWGRNVNGQLGHGDLMERNWPTLVEGLKGSKVTWAATGRHHTVVVTDDGRSFSWGHNKHGQLGTGSVKAEMETSPKLLPGISKAKSVACGADFTAWITQGPEDADVPGAKANLLTAGLPQYGQLGHGTDNQYNAKEGTVKIVFDPQPNPRSVQTLAGKTIVKIACGTNHSVAVDSKGFVYTWGFGGYGRLGHREQKDEFKPRLVEIFQRTNVLPPNAVIAAGGAFSAATAGGGQMYMWGKVKPNTDNWMYPKPLMDLSGWNVRTMDCGPQSSCVAADNSCITWGLSQYGELGYGTTGPKSSANPKKVDALENFHVLSVACGTGHMMAVLSRSRWAGKPEDCQAHLDKLPVYEPPPDLPSQGKTTKAKAGAPAKGKGKAAAPKAVVEAPEEEPEEEEEGDEEDSEEEEKPAKKRKTAPKKAAKPKQAKQPAKKPAKKKK